MGILDRLPASIRHLVFSVASVAALALLYWANDDFINWNLPAGLVAVVAAVIPVLIAAATPLTRQYGVGSTPSDIPLAPSETPGH